MRFKFSDLWRWDGTVDRGIYALVGLIGFAIKSSFQNHRVSARQQISAQPNWRNAK